MADSPDPLAPKRPLEGVEIARITISRVLVGDETVDHVTAVDYAGEDLVLSEAMSILSMAQMNLYTDRREG